MPSSGSAFAREVLPVSPLPPPVTRIAVAYRAIEHAFDVPFGPALNPFKHLGALGFLLFWLLVVSGVVLYVLLDTSAEGAYRSIDELAQVPWMLGTALRGLHRYAADGFVIIMLAHLAREWVLGRYKGFRRVPWLTGVPLIALAFVCGIGGFWLNWDQLGQYSAVATAEWLDTLPLLASPLARNFLGDGNLNRLFTLFVFVHIGMPVLMLFGLWFHIQRISLAKVFPPRALALGTTATLLLLALVLPVRSQGPADLTRVPESLQLDWILLFIHPLTVSTSELAVWALLVATFAGLVALPLLPARRQPVAEVHPDHCSGCRRCFDDCPYSAITMVPHTNGRRGVQLAVVDADLCASCGICVGSCPRPHRFAGRRYCTRASTCRSGPSTICASVCCRVWRPCQARSGMWFLAVTRARRPVPLPRRTYCISALSALVCFRPLSLNTPCAAVPMACWSVAAARADASSVWASAGRRSASAVSVNPTCAPQCPQTAGMSPGQTAAMKPHWSAPSINCVRALAPRTIFASGEYPMNRAFNWIGQALLYSCFALAIGVFRAGRCTTRCNPTMR